MATGNTNTPQDTKPTPTPTPTDPLFGPGGSGGTSNDGTQNNSTTMVYGVPVYGRQSDTHSVVWKFDNEGNPLYYVNKAKAYGLDPRSKQFKYIVQSFNSGAGALVNKATVAEYWKYLVDKSSGTGVSPFQMAANYASSVSYTHLTLPTILLV